MQPLNILSIRTASLLLVTALFAGCGPAGPGPKIVSPPSRPVSMITPIEFFSPEQKRLGQHLNWNVGCFKVDYSGPAAKLQQRLEVWKNGKPDGNSGSSSLAAGNAELSISARESGGTPGTLFVTQVLSKDGGSSSTAGGYTRPELGSYSTSIARIQGPVDLQPGQETAVWALIIRKTNPKSEFNSSTATPVAEQAAKSDWALVLNVKLEPGK